MPELKDRLLVHIGYHKTGTKWMQRQLFRSPEAGFVMPWSIGETLRRLVLVNPFDFDPAQVRADFETALAEARASSSPAGVPVISMEALSGNPHSGGHDSRWIADRLASGFPRARILMIVREQRGMVVSAYKAYVRQGGVASLRQYLTPPRGAGRIPQFAPSYLEYHWLVAYYQQLFTPEKVLVLPYELLREDPEDFVGRIVRFAGARLPATLSREVRHPGLSGFGVALKRRVNRLFVRDSVNLSPMIDRPGLGRRLEAAVIRLDRRAPRRLSRRADRKLAEGAERYCSGRFAESNKTTAYLAGLDLERFGYEM